MRSLVLAVSTLACTALAQEPPPEPPVTPASPVEVMPSSDRGGPGDGLQMEVNVLGANSFGNVFTVLSGSTASVSTSTTSVVSPSAAFGYLFGKNSVLLNVGLLGFGPGTNVAFSLNPLFRHYFLELRTGTVSPFVEGGLSFGILSPANGNASYLLGLFGGAGAEWLFVKNIGLIVDALVEYGHAHFPGGGFSGESNVDVIGFAGNVGVTVHW
jgi:hypothetical protein